MKKRVLISFTFVVVIILILVFYIKIHPDMEKNFSIYNHVFRNIEHELRKSFSEEQLLSFSEILRAISQYDWKDIGNEQGT